MSLFQATIADLSSALSLYPADCRPKWQITTTRSPPPRLTLPSPRPSPAPQTIHTNPKLDKIS